LKIIPQIKGRADYGYPFSTSGQLHMREIEASVRLKDRLREFDSICLKLTEREGNALAYIAYRDLDERLKAYMEFARACEEHSVPDGLRPGAAAV
jgi:hypothetical protein